MEGLAAYPDMVQHLLLVPEGLGLRNVNALRSTCKAWRRVIRNVPQGFYRARVVSMLDEWGIDGNSLCKSLSSSSGEVFASGSFILRSVLGSDESWTPGDLDIFSCVSDADMEISSMLVGRGYVCDEQPFSPYGKPFDDAATGLDVVTYVGRSHAVQFIFHSHLNRDNLKGCVDGFNLSFCALSFDGNTVTVPDGSVWRSVLTKTATVSTHTDRTTKYVGRGFEISHSCKRSRTK